MVKDGGEVWSSFGFVFLPLCSEISQQFTVEVGVRGERGERREHGLKINSTYKEVHQC